MTEPNKENAPIDAAAEAALIKELQTKTLKFAETQAALDAVSGPEALPVSMMRTMLKMCGDHKMVNDQATPEISGRILSVVRLHQQRNVGLLETLKGPDVPLERMYEVFDDTIVGDHLVDEVMLIAEKLVAILEGYSEEEAIQHAARRALAPSMKKLHEELLGNKDTTVADYAVVRSIEMLMLSQYAASMTLRIEIAVLSTEARHTEKRYLQGLQTSVKFGIESYLAGVEGLDRVKNKISRLTLKAEIDNEHGEAEAEAKGE